MARSRSAVYMNVRWLERLKPPKEGREEHFDEEVRGLGLRISSTGRMSWFVLYRIPGDTKIHRYTLNPNYPYVSLGEARDQARALLVEIRKGSDPAEGRKTEKKAPTFREVAEEFLEKHAKKCRKYAEFIRALEKDVLPSWGDRKAKDIRKRDVIDLLDAIADRPAPIQANRTLALVRKVFNWAISRDILEFNPCAQVKPISEENERERVLDDAEILRAWKAFDALDSSVGSIFKLMLLTAQRGGEVRKMRWGDIDLTGAWWTIPAEVAKNARTHRVSLSSPALELLKEIRQLHTDPCWVFPSPTRQGQPISEIQKAFQRARLSSGLDDFVAHDLRRAASTGMRRLGVSQEDLSKVLNHSRKNVTDRYDRYECDAEKRRALDIWAEHLTSLIGNK